MIQHDDADPICDHTGICRPLNTDKGTSNCIFCGKELVEVDGEWKSWDWDLVLKQPSGVVKEFEKTPPVKYERIGTCGICGNRFDTLKDECPYCHTHYEYDVDVPDDVPTLPDNLKQAISQMIQDPDYQRIYNLTPPSS
jgi:hypothetical protein